MNIFSSFTGKLITFFLIIIIIPIIVLGIVYYNEVNDSASEKLMTQREALIKQVKSNIDRYHEYMKKISKAAYYDTRVMEYFKINIDSPNVKAWRILNEANNFFESAEVYSEQVLTIYFVRSDHKFISSTFDNSTLESISKQINIWEKEMNDENETVIVKTMVDKWGEIDNLAPNTTISHVRKVIDYHTSKVLGYIVIDLDYRMFDKVLKDGINDMLIVETDSKVVIRGEVPKDIASATLFDKVELMHSKGEFFSMVSTPQVKYFIHQTPLKFNNLILVSLYSTQESSVNVVDSVKYLIVIAVLVLFFGVLISYFMSRNILLPVKSLIVSMKKVEKGDFTSRSEVEGANEIQEMSHIYNVMVNKISELISEIRLIEQKKKQAEIYALQAQINPHFIYNTLSTIKWMGIMQNNTSIVKMVDKFINIMQYSSNFTEQLITIRNEMDFLRDYISIQSVKYSDKVDFRINVCDDCMDNKVLKFIIQPIIENALFHGLDPKDGKGVLEIRISKLEDCIQILICDDGIGMSKEQLDKVKSGLLHSDNRRGLNNIGLNNIYERIQARYGEKYKMSLNSIQGNGTQVSIMFPIIIQ